MKAIQEPNVDVHFTAASHITANGVVGADGIERKCDTIVCATGITPSHIRTLHYEKINSFIGFDVSFKPRFPVIGKNGVSSLSWIYIEARVLTAHLQVNLQDKWANFAEAYFGLACADMPNWITFLGPNWPVAAGSMYLFIPSPILQQN
jgi:hypothetical protein